MTETEKKEETQAVEEGVEKTVERAEDGKKTEEPQPDYYDQLVRLKAEFENFRKRTDKEKTEFVRYGRVSVLLKLLPIYDVLLQAHHEVLASHNDTPLAKGMEGIFKEFEKLFKDEHIIPMEAVGKPFDSMRHEVIGTVEDENFDDDVVVDVAQSGFMMADKVLRTAKVRIAKKAADKKETGKGEETK